MIAAVLRCELRLPASHSLKEKRGSLRPVIEGLKRLVSVSVAEVDHQNAWQRATLGVAIVSRPSEIDRLVDTVIGYLERQVDVELVECEVGYLDTSQPIGSAEPGRESTGRLYPGRPGASMRDTEVDGG